MLARFGFGSSAAYAIERDLEAPLLEWSTGNHLVAGRLALLALYHLPPLPLPTLKSTR